MTRVLLPLSTDAVKEIAQQVTLRGQPERVGTKDGRLIVDLAGVCVIDEPEKKEKVQ